MPSDSSSESPGITFHFLLVTEDFPEDVAIAFGVEVPDFGPREEGLAADGFPLFLSAAFSGALSVDASFARVRAIRTEECVQHWFGIKMNGC